MSSCKVQSLDHVVLTVASIEDTVAFYTSQLGMKHEVFTSGSMDRPRPLPSTFSPCPHARKARFARTAGFARIDSLADGSMEDRHALLFGSQKLNLHLSGKEFEPKAARVQPGSADLCFVTQDPIDEVLQGWKGAGMEVS
ncbi:uncharacterized protein LTR77_003965 [Saxophila tyrrhenica]|uniref:VOC domain-containing protein n=1 Tax=Saxophila tyrrhenica TaxID=1690608 RepID=A0AAV9PGQ0_9PEZI|nr:hypothetical protein LTR77_003965 [Saxophila tyrrhenica]